VDIRVIREQHPDSQRTATFEDDGTSAWLFLSEPKGLKLVADAWVYNRVPAPTRDQVKSFRSGPPPAAEGYAGPDALCEEPTKFDWRFQWSMDGHSVAILQDGIPVAAIIDAQRPGMSRSLIQNGPWGIVWDDSRLRSVLEVVNRHL
jgi:hypothetical protein